MAWDKTECPITRGEFSRCANPIIVKIGDETFTVKTKEFSTGSLGWYLSGKTKQKVNGEECTVQIGLNLTIVGSKELPKDPAKELVGR